MRSRTHGAPRLRFVAGVASLLLMTAPLARAETIKIARQYGVAFIPFMLMEEQHLIEQHAAALGRARPGR